MLLGGPADLGVDDTVVGQVLGRLPRDPGQALRGLHHADGMGEGLQVALQRPRVRAVAEPARQAVRVGRGQVGVRELLRQLGHGGRAHAAVEVVVEQDLGRGADGLNGGAGGEVDGHALQPIGPGWRDRQAANRPLCARARNPARERVEVVESQSQFAGGCGRSK